MELELDLDFVKKPTVLVVDDTPDNLALMSGLLRKDYRVKVATNGQQAIHVSTSDDPPDLILLDIMMPGMDGYTACAILKADPRTRPIPIIFLTAKTEVEDETRGLELGAVDYLTKPVRPPIALARIKTHLALKASADFLRNQNDFLETEVDRRTREVMMIQDVTILAMASLAETLVPPTGIEPISSA
jgi:putative two-component system response regulator